MYSAYGKFGTMMRLLLQRALIVGSPQMMPPLAKGKTALQEKHTPHLPRALVLPEDLGEIIFKSTQAFYSVDSKVKFF
jgi:hypothetical protein